MRKLTLLLINLFIIGIGLMNAQTKRVTGNVTSADDGQPIPGVSIQVKGTSLGTVTDVDGNYAIQVPDDAQTLVFSFVGMQQQEVSIAGTTTADVAMSTSFIGMDEVVVTALGISREKKSLGYATQGVNNEDLMAAQNANPIQSLSGKVAGLTVSGQNFSGSQNVLIRGASSFNGSSQPLYVVDGVPIDNGNFNSTSAQNGSGGYDYGNMVNDLNSYDIENVEVLKGSAASALYGSRGANGVIMITTKSGKAGKKTFSVDVNSGVSFETVYLLPEQQNSYGGGYGDFDEVTIGGQTYKAVSYAIDESWGPKYDGQQVLHWWGIEDYNNGVTDSPVTAAWKASANDVDSYYETGVTFTNSVNVVTTDEVSALRIGYTNKNTNGTLPNQYQNKHNLNVNGSTKLWDGFAEVNGNVTMAHTYTRGRQEGGYGDNSQSQKFFQWGQRQLDFSKLSNYKNADGSQRTWNRSSIDDPTPKYSDNPYWTAYKNYEDDSRMRIFGTTGLKINFTDYISAQGNVYWDTYAFTIENRTAVGSQATSYYSKSVRQNTEMNYEAKLNFNKDFNDFSVLAMLGANKRDNYYNYIAGETSGGLVIPDLYDLNNSADQALAYDNKQYKIVNSLFGYASVGWRNLAYLEGTYRKDYDTSLPTGANEYDYMSLSGSLILSELFDVPVIDNLKIRANYGETGNGTDPYSAEIVYDIDNTFNGNPTYSNPSTLNNLTLVPEQTYEYEVGIEGSFLRNRLGVDISLYTRDTENQIVSVDVSPATGFTSRVINNGTVNNKGIEILLNGTPIRMQNFSWNIGINFARNINTVTELDIEELQFGRAPFGGAYVKAARNQSMLGLYGYDYIYHNGQKVIDESGFYATNGSLSRIGNVLPDYTAGVRNSFNFLKSFDASVLIDISKGGNYYSLTNMWAMYSGMDAKTATATSNGNTIREDGIVLDGLVVTATDTDGNITAVKENDTNISAIDYGELHYHGYGTPSATSIFDASYMKLREVTLGYTLPPLMDQIKSVKVSLYGRNLAVWGLANKGIDPETIVNGSGNIQGLEGGLIPGAASYGVNVQIKF